MQLLDKFKFQLKQNFEVKILGKARLILVILVKKNIKYKTLHLSDTYYIQVLLSTYDMIEATLISIPMVKRSTILLSKGKDAKFDITDYQRLIEKLMYLSQIT